jgi:2-polyprenyl-6-methoxyphenol hydroxylase-like FAD-dependent oxidoreductase
VGIRVVVVGAGLGGLALAQGLSRQGIDVVVYERDAANGRRQGDRVQLGPTGLAGLRRVLSQELHDLCLATAGRPLAPPRMLDQKLKSTAENACLPQEYTPETQTCAVHRATLREILLTGVNVRYGKEFTAYELVGDRVKVRFEYGHEDEADLLVGADGVGSAVRRQLLPHAEVNDAGLRLIYGRIPLHRRWPWGPTRHCGMARRRATRSPREPLCARR